MKKILIEIVKLIISLFLIIYFVSCFTPSQTSSSKSWTENDSSTIKKIGDINYDFSIKKSPSIENPIASVEVQKAQKYQIDLITKEKIITSRSRTPWGTLWCWIGLPISGIYIYSGMSSPQGNFVLYSAIGAALTWVWAVFRPRNKEKTVIINSSKDIFYKAKPVINSPVIISHLSKESKYVTDNIGILAFNPKVDFNINSSENEYPIEFSLSLNKISFEKKLNLRPSLWLNMYVRIIKNNCDIKSSLSYSSKEISSTYLGFEYPLFIEKESMYQIKLCENKDGWLSSDCAEIFYSDAPKKNNYTDAIKRVVEDKIKKWQIQGEFETPEIYARRISTIDEKVKEVTEEAMYSFKQDEIKHYSWQSSTISAYDPNNKTYKINIPDLKEITIKISDIDTAKAFKISWYSVKFINQNFILVDGNWELASLDLLNESLNYTVHFDDNNIPASYDPTSQLALNFEPIKIIIPEIQGTTIKENKIADNYNIKTNLPVTKMSNPDAIAVVIGNTNYTQTSPVNYAVNDAQLMKIYLMNVLGYKEDNIIFIKNATKAVLEGLFGIEGKPQGKLFTYIKSQKSDVFIFYSGHGAPGLKDQQGYFVPVDGDPSYIELQGYSTEVFYNNLAQLPAKSITVVLDACFSGIDILKNVSGVKIKPKKSQTNATVFSSSTDEQFSTWYNQKQNGLFTYFFLRAIHDKEHSDKNKDGNLTIQEIYDYVSDKTEGVPYFARRLNNVEQNPVLKCIDCEKVFVTY